MALYKLYYLLYYITLVTQFLSFTIYPRFFVKICIWSEHVFDNLVFVLWCCAFTLYSWFNTVTMDYYTCVFASISVIVDNLCSVIIFVSYRQCWVQTKFSWMAGVEEVTAVSWIPTQRCHWRISAWQRQTSNSYSCAETTKDVSLDGNEYKFTFHSVLQFMGSLGWVDMQQF